MESNVEPPANVAYHQNVHASQTVKRSGIQPTAPEVIRAKIEKVLSISEHDPHLERKCQVQNCSGQCSADTFERKNESPENSEQQITTETAMMKYLTTQCDNETHRYKILQAFSKQRRRVNFCRMRDAEGNSLLHHILMSNNSDALEVFFNAGLMRMELLQIQNKKGFTPLNLTESSTYKKLIELVELERSLTVLDRAARIGDCEIVKSIIERHPGTTRNIQQYPSVFWAVTSGCVICFELLKGQITDWNLAIKLTDRAFLYNHSDIGRSLLNILIESNRTTINSSTIFKAVINNNHTLLHEISAHGFGLENTDAENSRSAVILTAIMAGNVNTLQKVMDLYKEHILFVKSTDGRNFIQLCVEKNLAEPLKKLLKTQDEDQMKRLLRDTFDGSTALQMALYKSSDEEDSMADIVLDLCKKYDPGSLQEVFPNGKTPYQIADERDLSGIKKSLAITFEMNNFVESVNEITRHLGAEDVNNPQDDNSTVDEQRENITTILRQMNNAIEQAKGRIEAI